MKYTTLRILPLALPLLAPAAAASTPSGIDGAEVPGHDADLGLGARDRLAPRIPTVAGDLLDGQPISFVENLGQWRTPASFVARAGAMIVRLEPEAIGVELREFEEGDTLRTQQLRLRFAGAEASVTLEGEGVQPGVRNYLIGNDPERWRSGVKSYASVLYRGLYPGIDLRLREQGGGIEYDLMLEPDVDPAPVLLHCEGVEGLAIEADGALRMNTELGPVYQSPPRTWEVLEDGERREIECRFVLRGEDSFGFELPRRDTTRAVVIDPGLQWSTLYGGSDADHITGVDRSTINGHVIVGGWTKSWDLQGASGTLQGISDGFVAEFDPTATGIAQLVWATYVGGNGVDLVLDLELDDQGHVLLTGITSSTDFPTTAGAYDTTPNGGWDAFVVRLAGDGTMTVMYGTYLGGQDMDYGATIDAHAPGSVTVAGTTSSTDFPWTLGAFQTVHGGLRDNFVVQLSLAGAGATDLTYSTYLGGSDNEGTGSSGSTADLKTLGVQVDSTGAIAVVGKTKSGDFPTTPGAYDQTPNGNMDGYVARLDPAGNSASDLVYSTFVGGSGWDGLVELLVASPTVIVAGGSSYSSNFPTTPEAFQPSFHGPAGYNDPVLLWLDTSQTGLSQLAYSTYLGADGYGGVLDLTSDGLGGVFAVGFTGPEDPGGTSFRTTPGAYQVASGGAQDGFVLRLARDGTGAGDLRYSTLIGLGGDDSIYGVARVPGATTPEVTCAGHTSLGIPTTSGAFQTTYGGGSFDAFAFQLETPPDFTSFCFGDPGSGASCPCGNDNDGSVPESGCANGIFASGAQLTGSGIASITADTLVLATTHLQPNNSGLYFQANNDLSPGIIWGDGLQCAGGGLIRLGVRFSDASGYSDTSGYPHTISGRSAAFGHPIAPGETLYYQCWYRNPNGSPCGLDFNTSNGCAVIWLP
jgi:hypothetical protein